VCEKEFSPFKQSHRRQCCSDACRRQRDEARYVVKRVLTTAEAAYLAGLVDGEGTISVWRHRAPRNSSGYTYVPIFTIAQANQPFLEEIRDIVGNGSVRRANRASLQNPKHKDCYTLSFRAHQTRWVLPQILPYLRIKRRQADLLLEYYTSTELGRRISEGHDVRAGIYAECHRLNAKGPRGHEFEGDLVPQPFSSLPPGLTGYAGGAGSKAALPAR
jgi:hypothetical protein